MDEGFFQERQQLGVGLLCELSVRAVQVAVLLDLTGCVRREIFLGLTR
jgi:hypothetical protein